MRMYHVLTPFRLDGELASPDRPVAFADDQAEVRDELLALGAIAAVDDGDPPAGPDAAAPPAAPDAADRELAAAHDALDAAGRELADAHDALTQIGVPHGEHGDLPLAGRIGLLAGLERAAREGADVVRSELVDARLHIAALEKELAEAVAPPPLPAPAETAAPAEDAPAPAKPARKHKAAEA